MISLLSIHWLLAAALWYVINGILHDIAVISKHASEYDRDLMRLLMDGHLLILSGALMLVSWLMLRQGITWGYLIGGIVTLAMIVYCAMIFPFLKSIFTLVISIIVFLVCIVGVWP